MSTPPSIERCLRRTSRFDGTLPGPRAAQIGLLLHDQEIDPPFMDALREVLPDEADRLAYLNHLAWQART